MKKTLTVFALCIAGLAQASDWKAIGYTDSMQANMEMDSISRIDRYIKAWVTNDYFSDQIDSSNTSYRSSLILYYFDCKNRMTAVKEFSNYELRSRKGKIVFSARLEPSMITWEDVPPDSLIDELLKVACKRKVGT